MACSLRLILLNKTPIFRTFLGARCYQTSRCLQNEATADGNNEHEEEQTYTAEEIETDVKSRILEASLAHVHELGWTHEALAAGAEMEGYPSIAHGMFTKGGVDLINYFYTISTDKMADMMKKEKDDVAAGVAEKKPTPKFLRDAMEARLRMIIPYIDTWPQAMGTMALPQNAVDGWSNLARVVDELWANAGDKSHDFNWYTKRLSLAYVYKTTEISMLQDQSPDFQDTWSFLDRRMVDVREAGQCVKQLQNSGDLVNGAYRIARNVLGLNRR